MIATGTVSLIGIVRTDRTFVDVARWMNREYGRLEAAKSDP